MKKIILTWAVILTVGLSGAFASKDEGINPVTLSSFNKEFVTARNVSWQKESTYVKATFTINDQVLFAYYSSDNNELLAVVRNILSQQLPINLFTSLRKDYKDYWISSLFEVAKPDHTSYFITLENSNETIILKAIGSSEWTLYQKIKKS